MKIAVSSEGAEITAGMDLRFGRARWFLIFDTETSNWETHDNSANADAPGGAGPMTVQGLVDLGVGVVITGRVGPKAHTALKAASISLYQAESITVKEAVQKLQEGELERIQSPESSKWAVG
jgi:predicted Fe-Mo cluster-binding NifX family protein